MKVLVDTSVWIDFFNGYPSPEAETLANLIAEREEIVTCGVVIAEFMQGLRGSDLRALERHFRDMSSLVPRDPDTYIDAATLYRALRRRGITIRSTIDCLIVRLAEEHGALLLARDRDIRAILNAGLSRVRAVSHP